MDKPFAVLLMILLATQQLLASDLSATSGGSALSPRENEVANDSDAHWSEAQVASWAAARSASANLLQSERAAFSSSIDRDDRKQCAQAVLVQAVLRDLECHERERSAARALTVFHQLRGLKAQSALLDDAYRSTDKLLRLAEKANELDLVDGNRFELDKQRLGIADQQAEAAGGIAKLQVALSELVDRPLKEVMNAELEAQADAPKQDLDFDQAFAIALFRRCDLKAMQTLCQSINADTLPMVRQVMSSLQPGLGLALAIATRKPLLNSLHHDDHSTAEACQRREQCNKLRNERRSQIESEVRLAIIDRDTAAARLSIAKQRIAIDEQLVKQSVVAIELDQAKPGADIVAELERLRSEGKIIEQQTSLAVAAVKLREGTGTVLDGI